MRTIPRPAIGNHALLSSASLAWGSSGHTGTPTTAPVFDGTGLPALLGYSKVGGNAGFIIRGDDAGLLDPSFLPFGGFNTRGSYTPTRLLQGRFYFPNLISVGTTNKTLAIGTTYAIFCPQFTADQFSQMAFSNSINSVGKFGRLWIAKVGSTGFPHTPIWVSPDIALDTSGIKNIAFSNGGATWVDNSYQVGSNFFMPPGGGCWLCFEMNVAGQVAAAAAGNARLLPGQSTTDWSTTANTTLITGTNTFGNGAPSPFGAATEVANTSAPILALLAA